MTMHLLPPMFSTTGKKKGKAKHRNADAANKARCNAEAWQQLLEKYDVKTSKVVVGKSKSVRATTGKGVVNGGSDWRSRIDPRRLTDHIPSVDTGVGLAAKPADKVYTGNAMLGVSVLHKSNGIPVFRQEDAVDISKMRRG
jgi:hypothetical protein